MSIIAGATAGASALGLDLGNVFQPISSLFGNNRGEKRARRDELLEALWSSGVSRQALTKVSSDHIADLENLIQWVQRTGQPAIDYLNQTRPAGTGPDWDDKIIANFDQWQRTQNFNVTRQQPPAVKAQRSEAVPVDKNTLFIGGGILLALLAFFNRKALGF